MTVLLAFVRPHAEPVPSGPYEKVSFSQGDLIADGEPVATYVDSRWQLRGASERFSSVEFRCRVDVHFELGEGERSKAFGPYSTLRLLDGIAYASGHVFACFDKEKRDWYSLPLGRHWPAMSVVAAAAAAERQEPADLADDGLAEDAAPP